jgi:hypothetical protein
MKWYTYLPVSDSTETIPLLQEGIINLAKTSRYQEHVLETIPVADPHMTFDYYTTINENVEKHYKSVKNRKSLNNAITLPHIYFTQSYISNEIIIALSVWEDNYKLLEKFYTIVSYQKKKRDSSLINKFMLHEMNADYFLPHVTIVKQKLKPHISGDLYNFLTDLQLELSDLYDVAMDVNFTPPELGQKLLMKTG